MASNEPSTLVKVDGDSDEESKTYNGVSITDFGAWFQIYVPLTTCTSYSVPPETCGDISEISRKKLRGKMPQIAGNIADFVKYCGIIVVKLRKLRPILVLVL